MRQNTKQLLYLTIFWFSSLYLVYLFTSNNVKNQFYNRKQRLNDGNSIVYESSFNFNNDQAQVPETQQKISKLLDQTQVYYDRNRNQIHPNVLVRDDGTLYHYNHTSPIVFIGGMPRSGTTLMRVMLDAHDDVRCGEETRVIPKILGIRNNWYKSEKESNRLELAGVTPHVVDEALRQFILEVIVRHGEPANYLCNKDPFTLKSQNYLSKLFPNAKFIFMVRDGRATAHSIIERKVTITGFDITSYRDVLTKWNRAVESMHNQCVADPKVCLPVQYEQLVLHPEKNLRRIAEFLGIPFSEKMVHHDQHLTNRISAKEPSTGQVKKPLYLDALTAWYGYIPKDVERDMETIAPMLKKLGYSYNFGGKKPSYGEPDKSVLENLEKSKFEHEWANPDGVVDVN